MSAWDQLDRDPVTEALVKWHDVEGFLATEPAKLIVQEAADRARDAILGLLNCDPSDRASIAEFQARARVFHDLGEIIGSIMDRGRAAEHQQAQQAEH